MLSVTLMIIVSFIGLYLSSQPFLEGLQEVNSANTVMTSVARVIEALDTSDAELEKVLGAKKVKDIQYTFNENQKLLRLNLEQAIERAEGQASALQLFNDASDAVLEYEVTVTGLLTRLSQTPPALFREMKEQSDADIMVARQYSNDARESLRKGLINIKDRSDISFSTIYQNRYRPLIVGVIGAVIFLFFVMFFGFSIIRRLRQSFINLSTATEHVAQGDLNYQAPILNQDELGNLTSAFNRMVWHLDQNQQQLKLATDKITRLQQITSSFSEALTPDQVFDIIVKQGFDALNAQAGVVYIISDDKAMLERKRSQGYDQEIVARFKDNVEVNLPIPICEVYRYGKPIYLESKEVLLARYPYLKSKIDPRAEGLAVLPLSVGSEVLGVLAFSFHSMREFSADDRQFTMALARQCAQALHRSQLFADAKKAIQVRDEFLSIASHELKTPLTPLKLQLQSLGRQVAKGQFQNLPPEKLNKIIENSDRQISRLTILIEDLLDVSRITSGKLKLNREEFNLREMIDEVVKQYEEQLKKVESEIRIENVANVVGHLDKVRIEQVLINFLTNAEKYAPGKPIVISLQTSDDSATISVKDLGPGIAPEDQKRIFDRFERIKARDNIGGLGLGLYISKQIIEAHGGHISVESEEGKGATFIAQIPLHTSSLVQ